MAELENNHQERQRSRSRNERRQACNNKLFFFSAQHMPLVTASSCAVLATWVASVVGNIVSCLITSVPCGRPTNPRAPETEGETRLRAVVAMARLSCRLFSLNECIH